MSNVWATCPVQRDNSEKLLLIPHKPTIPHGNDGKDYLYHKYFSVNNEEMAEAANAKADPEE